MTSFKDDLWAITAYFNPAGYRRRLANFKAFRQRLGIRLVTVELAYDRDFELGAGDGDVLVQVRSNCLLWHKEKLLNIALSRVPTDVTYVAWLDCDVVFERDDWAERTCNMLGSVPIGQPFTRLYELGRDVFPWNRDLASISPATYSLAYKAATDRASGLDESLPNWGDTGRAGVGFAWAAQRKLLDGCGLYDAMILGGGDRTISGAAYGRFEDPIRFTHLSERQIEHYLNWALPFFEEVRGRVGFVEGGLTHLWHGDLENRQYVKRHRDLATFKFDPFRDLCTDEQGCWAWKTENRELREYIKNYFVLRKEDGDHDDQQSPHGVSVS